MTKEKWCKKVDKVMKKFTRGKGSIFAMKATKVDEYYKHGLGPAIAAYALLWDDVKGGDDV